MWGGVKQQNKSAEAGRRPLEQSATVRVISPEDHLQLYMYMYAKQGPARVPYS